MTRISENQTVRALTDAILRNRRSLDKYSTEVSTGYKVIDPGDSNQAGTISLFKQSLDRIAGYNTRIANAQSSLAFQDDILVQVGDLITRAKEIATQAGNGTNGSETRLQMAEEVFQLREHLIQLANSRYQGRYLYGGADDDDPPYDQVAAYTNPATGDASLRYQWDNETGTDVTRTIEITDDLSLVVNTPGSNIFDNALYALERLGRALAGYQTNPASGQPDGTGNAYVFPDELALQTDDIADTIDMLNTAREQDIMTERVDIGGRMRRLETAQAILELHKGTTLDALSKLQDADIAESATKYTQAQNALQASMTVSLQVANLSILDYL